MLVFREPREHVAGAGKGIANDLRIGAVHPVVVQHADPEEGEGGDVLREGTGVAAAGYAFGMRDWSKARRAWRPRRSSPATV